MNEHDIQPIHDRSSSKAHLVAKLIRYRNLFLSKWWIPVVTIGLGVAVEVWLSRIEPASFVSVGRMIVSIKLAIPEGSVYSEELDNFLGTQAALMQSRVVIERARARVGESDLGLSQQAASLRVSVSPKTSIFVLEAKGRTGEYVQAFLQAAMEEYIKLKREMRVQTSDVTVAGLTEQVLRLEKELRGCQED